MAGQPWLPATWDRQADVVVVGFGAAGAATAITAYEAGAQVILYERKFENLAREGQNRGALDPSVHPMPDVHALRSHAVRLGSALRERTALRVEPNGRAL